MIISSDENILNNSTFGYGACLTTSKSSGSKHGRGKSIGIKSWCSVNKLKVQFDVNNKPLGDEGTALMGQLGIMVRNSYRVPLTYLNWKSIPNHIKEGIWKEVQDNLEFCPDEFKSACMDSCRRIYKDNKAKIKAEHYTAYMFPNADPNIASRVPSFVDPDQWKQLVAYWQLEEVAIAANGENLDKMSIYLKTRTQENPEVKEIVAEYNRQVELLSEDERTIEARDRIFHSIVGKDNHGYCRTYGGGVPHSSVYKKDSGPSQTINPSSMAEIEQRIEARLTERFTTQFEQLQSQMFGYMESSGSEARQVN
ncbi:hypothetical protein RHMOL_Rhmol02G0277800 [Rhododendron molle]|uniref:Uncharacterized protein n=1 Tax=Rhododendron molle TaxID=49168 RepID=A0ACC0PW79_RHOML|nr:hypothetical protein RHMOL_Rhmol02G0277800 [Rhododendron molle]